MDNNFDSLLKEKSNQDRKAAWKKEIPIPPATEAAITSKRRYGKLVIGVISVAAAIAIFLFYNPSDSKISLIDNYIQSTPIAALDENVTRGDNTTDLTTDKSKDAEFLYAAQLVKKDNPNYNEGIKLLEPFTVEKNKYQLEALWLKALAHAKLNEKDQALKELNKLQTISKYQENKISKLIQHLK